MRGIKRSRSLKVRAISLKPRFDAVLFMVIFTWFAFWRGVRTILSYLNSVRIYFLLLKIVTRISVFQSLCYFLSPTRSIRNQSQTNWIGNPGHREDAQGLDSCGSFNFEFFIIATINGSLFFLQQWYLYIHFEMLCEMLLCLHHNYHVVIVRQPLD